MASSSLNGISAHAVVGLVSHWMMTFCHQLSPALLKGVFLWLWGLYNVYAYFCAIAAHFHAIYCNLCVLEQINKVSLGISNCAHQWARPMEIRTLVPLRPLSVAPVTLQISFFEILLQPPKIVCLWINYSSNQSWIIWLQGTCVRGTFPLIVLTCYWVWDVYVFCFIPWLIT